MSLLSRIEFSELNGVTTGYVNMYIKRKKIMLTSDNRIDTENPVNKLFSKNLKANKSGKKKVATSVKKESEPIQKIYEKVVEPIKEVEFTPKETATQKRIREKQNKESEEEVDWDKRKKIADALKAEKQAEKEALTVEKLQGQLIPIELMKTILKINIQGIIKTFESNLINTASIYCDVMAGGDRDLLAEVTEELRKDLQVNVSRAEDSSAQEIEIAINSFVEQRAVGEKK